MAEPNPNLTVVLHACLGVGHLIPMVELAKLVLSRVLSITIAVPTPPASTADFFDTSASAVAAITAANQAVSFHHLPASDYPVPYPDPFLQMLDALRLTIPALAAFLRSLPSVTALVLDLFCVDALDAAESAGVPAYFYYTSYAGAPPPPHYFAVTDGGASFKDMGKEPLRFPGVPPIPASDMPHTVLDREDRTCAERIRHYARIPEARGVPVNTYEWLEARAVRALRDGVCVPGHPTPLVYPIGSLIVKGQEAAEKEARHACLAWLDAQPARSVVFLCFGSLGTVLTAQPRRRLAGWGAPATGSCGSCGARPRTQASSSSRAPSRIWTACCQRAFLDRTRDRGMVVKMWAP
ncbi:hypothetical protein U9M48_044619 [Paspalum notatum var. saurae]|uniref:Uncharacterized protein n=1 Tax=Paspalum notatum var. saurae TaxID=547442 RepID=A0AAQ3XIG5_PASNO